MSVEAVDVEPDLRHMLDRLALVERQVRDAVAVRRADDPEPDDPFRGLYLSDRTVDRILASHRTPFATMSAADGGGGRLGALARSAGLTELDVALLLVALAPDVDGRFEQLYGYLNDDVTRRRASVGLALRLCGLPEASAAGRARFGAAAPLLVCGLLVVEDGDRPFLSRSLRVPDRVAGHLLGDDAPDPALDPVTCTVAPVPAGGGADRLGQALRDGIGLVYLREDQTGAGQAVAAAALRAAGLARIGVDLDKLLAEADPATTARTILREAVLLRAGVILGPATATDSAALPHVLRVLLGATAPVLLHGQTGWDPQWTEQAPLIVPVASLPAGERSALWRQVLDGQLAAGIDPAAATAHFVLGPGQVIRAAGAAALQASYEDDAVRPTHLRFGARTQNAAGLEKLARRIEPAVGWADLVLPTAIVGQLRELAVRAHHREQVLGTWRMRPGGGRGRGITALFAGDSGTGKTMSAEVIAGDMDLDLYTVNLATVVDKYVGETEKNLERIFTQAAGVNGVLLFDEADAIFGKRSEVRDAHDRYANIESAYLLQRMETFDGLAVLATNLRANLDEAFTRRLDVVVDFPMPDEQMRLALWDRCLGDRLPRADDLDLAFCAGAFELAGGHIRSAAVTAAYLAADAGRPVRMADLVGAVAREYRKLGRLCLEREFGPFLGLARA